MIGDINTGGPVFSIPPGGSFAEGLTVRDWFAGMALAGLLAAMSSAGGMTLALLLDNASLAAFTFADAMIARRGKP